MKYVAGFLMLLASIAYGDLRIVAAENFYGDVAVQLGQPYVTVVSILDNPSQDPHLFSADPSIAVKIDQADMVVENGLGYDSWMDKLYQAGNHRAVLLTVGMLMDKKSGMNPHIWYDPRTMPTFARALVVQLCARDPQHATYYQQQLAIFIEQAYLYQEDVDWLRQRVAGQTVTATEPIAGYLTEALNLKMLNVALQWRMMNGADLSPQEIVQFERSLTTQRVRLLIYNRQVTNPTTTQLMNLAIQKGIPVVGVTETMPAGVHYWGWMRSQLDMLAQAFGTEVVHD